MAAFRFRRQTTHCGLGCQPDKHGLVLSFTEALLFSFYKKYPLLFGNWSEGTLYGVFIWSTLTSIFLIAGFALLMLIASISVRLGNVGAWLEKRFKIRSNPFG